MNRSCLGRPALRWRSRCLLLLLLFLASSATVAPGHLCPQSVLGELLENDTGQPVTGALVMLLDEGGREVRAYLTNEAGRFLLRAPSPGVYTVRAERIGLETVTSDPIPLDAGKSQRVTLRTRPRAIPLEGIRVEGEKECVLRPQEGMVLAQIWDEARKALRIQDFSHRSGLNRFRVVEYEREFDPQTRLALGETRRVQDWLTRNPIRSLPADDLLKNGFIRQDRDGGFLYYGPDASVLLSDDFLDTHCFKLTTHPRRPELVGLSFEPVRDRSLPDIAGTLWLDSGTLRLRSLEFGYTWSPWPEAIGTAQGQVAFEEIANGSWIVRSWWIRMPVMVEATGSGQGTRRGLRVGRIKEVGGGVDRIPSPGAPARESSTGTTISGRVWDSLRAQPMAGARVYLSGTQHATVSDSNGAYVMKNVPPGSYIVGFHHPRLDSLGVFPPGSELALHRHEDAWAWLTIPGGATVLRTLCNEQGWQDGTSAVVGVVQESSSRKPLSNVAVTMEWTDYRVVAGREVLSDVRSVTVRTGRQGRYRACGVPSLAAFSIRARLEGYETAVVRGEAPEEGVLVRDLHLQPSLSSPQAVPSRPRAIPLRPASPPPRRSSPGAVTGGINGTIMDGESGDPVADAEIELLGRGRKTFSDDDGSFSFSFVMPGPVTLKVRRVGYGAAQGRVQVREGEVIETEVRLAAEPIPLEPILVTATRRRILLPGLEDFDQRLKSGRGQFILEDQIRVRSPYRVSDLLQGSTGVTVLDNGRALYIRRTQCPPMVYVDGVKLTRCPVGAGPRRPGEACDPYREAAQAVNMLVPSSVMAIEVYRGPAEIPSEYLDSNSRCGVILIWTRRGGG